MKRHLGLTSILGGGAIALMATQPALASATQVTAVQVNPVGDGVEVVLETRAGDRPQIFTISRGNAMMADLINTQLQLPDGNGFLQNNPAPGISSVVVSQLDANSIRVTVNGETAAPAGQVQQGREGIVLSFNSNAGAQAAQPSQPSQVPAPLAQTPQPAPAPAPQIRPPAEPTPDVLVPNPEITIDGVPAFETQPTFAPPLLPRAVAPPVGDIAVSTADTAPPVIDLGTAERVPRLVLRDAPVRDVLSLLARAAGLNVAYIGEAPADPQAQQTGTAPAESAEVRISLDIENEPVQDVFNYVLRISGLQANRTGRTIFVGPRLPNEARQLASRTLRLNQVLVGPALNFLVGLGAETAISRERQVTAVTALGVEQAIQAQGGLLQQQAQTTTEQVVETLRAEFIDSTPLLRGLQVIGDERTNSVTLVGSPNLVNLAIIQLTQLDVRRRQVAVNVRVIDVDLLALDRAGTSFSFGVDDAAIINDGGIGVINFGRSSPAGVGIGPAGVPGTTGSIPGFNFNNFSRAFLLQLRAAVVNNNAKILTDPTLVVQEGQIAEVQLTEEVITNLEITREGTGDDARESVTVETSPAGLILRVQVDRIDDNGFVSLSVAPSITVPAASEPISLLGNVFDITLLGERRLTSGQVRVRDGQTLVLSGIIQDSDRTTVTKVPILGDIPLLGALFRSTQRENSRQEVIVLLTPQIIDDSDFSTFGYRYNPSAEAQQLFP